MKKKFSSWECECGFRYDGKEAPDECPECQRIDSFMKIPDELMVEEAQNYLEIEEEFGDMEEY
ncbi:MAG: hypothetical protein QXI33_00070 [Candidatus Pacearchaeota archaeon]